MAVGDKWPHTLGWCRDGINQGKWIEAAAYSLKTHPDKELERRVNEVVALMAGAQQPDGYLNTHFTVVEPEKRWANLADWHELYCAGHLIEGAVAYAAAVAGREKRFICSAARWLSEGRWRESAPVSRASEAHVEAPGVWLAVGSPGWNAWAVWWKENKGVTPPRDSRDGWRFPAPMPPARGEEAA